MFENTLSYIKRYKIIGYHTIAMMTPDKNSSILTSLRHNNINLKRTKSHGIFMHLLRLCHILMIFRSLNKCEMGNVIEGDPTWNRGL